MCREVVARDIQVQVGGEKQQGQEEGGRPSFPGEGHWEMLPFLEMGERGALCRVCRTGKEGFVSGAK